MPSPSSALATLRPDLAGSFMEFELELAKQGLIATEALKPIEVAKASGNYGIIPVEQLLKDVDFDRAPGGGYNRARYEFDDTTYATKEYGVEEPVDDNEATMYADYFDAEQLAAQRARLLFALNLEGIVSAAVFNATTWTGTALTTAVTNEWDDEANATPIDDVEGAVQYVKANSGQTANALILGWKAYRNLRNGTKSGQLIDRIKYAGMYDPTAGAITPQILAQAFDLKYVLVGGAYYNAALEGQSASLSPKWSDEYAMVCKIAETSDPREPCIGRLFHWSEDGSTLGGTVETYRDEPTRSNIVRIRGQYQAKILYTECGHLLSNIVT